MSKAKGSLLSLPTMTFITPMKLDTRIGIFCEEGDKTHLTFPLREPPFPWGLVNPGEAFEKSRLSYMGYADAGLSSSCEALTSAQSFANFAQMEFPNSGWKKAP